MEILLRCTENLPGSYRTQQRLGASTHKHRSVGQSVPLTCLLECLLVWPDDGAEAGKNQRAKSASSFLRSAVVVKGVLAQHEPVATLLDPVSSHLQQQPSFT